MAMEPQLAIGVTEEPQLFLLRVWLEHGAFRAALRQVGSGEPSFFTQPAQLSEFLNRALRPTVASEMDRSNRSKR